MFWLFFSCWKHADFFSCSFIQCIYMQTVNGKLSISEHQKIIKDIWYYFPLQLCHINDQWAQDYESLIQKMPANSTGYYSTSSTTSHQHIPICTQCLHLEKKLDESQNEVFQITAKLETLQHTIHQSNQQVAHLGNASRAIQNQVGCSESPSSSLMFIYMYIVIILLHWLQLTACTNCSLWHIDSYTQTPSTLQEERGAGGSAWVRDWIDDVCVYIRRFKYS